jgi:2-oxoglutarate ferredoxin oxidoreductase subunit delta
MAKIKINKERCKGCGLCIIFCPLGQIKSEKQLNKMGYKPAVFCVELDKQCTGCSSCAIICPEAAIEVFK